LEKCFISFAIVNLNNVVVDSTTVKSVDKNIPEQFAVTVNTDAVDSRDIIEVFVTNSKSLRVVDTMAEAKIWMDVLVKAFDMR